MTTPPDTTPDPHAQRFNQLVGEQNNLTMANVGAVLAYLARTFQIQYEAHLCPDFDLPPPSAEALCGLALICRTLGAALDHGAPPVVLADQFVVKD